MEYEKIYKPRTMGIRIQYHKHLKAIKIGDSLGLVLTEPLRILDVKKHDKISVRVENDCIIIKKIDSETNE